MAAAAILNLLLLPLLVTWPVSCSSWLHTCTNFINLTQTAAELLVFVQKSKMVPAAILNYYFVTPDHQGRRHGFKGGSRSRKFFFDPPT